jgi:hypothetical protein
MLTLHKLKIYRQFGGDLDGWARTSSSAEKSMMGDEDWFLIDELRQGLSIVLSGHASLEFAQTVERRLLALTEDESTREAIRSLAK